MHACNATPTHGAAAAAQAPVTVQRSTTHREHQQIQHQRESKARGHDLRHVAHDRPLLDFRVVEQLELQLRVLPDEVVNLSIRIVTGHLRCRQHTHCTVSLSTVHVVQYTQTAAQHAHLVYDASTQLPKVRGLPLAHHDRWDDENKRLWQAGHNLPDRVTATRGGRSRTAANLQLLVAQYFDLPNVIVKRVR